MNCFNHQNKCAVGLCKCCSKALCFDCATDLEMGLACKDKHESEVEAINMMIDSSTKAYSEAPKSIFIEPLFYLFMGLVFTGFGYFSEYGGGITDLPFIIGLGMIVYAVVVFIRIKALFKDEK